MYLPKITLHLEPNIKISKEINYLLDLPKLTPFLIFREDDYVVI